MTIVLNCVTMAMESPVNEKGTEQEQLLTQLDLIFLLVYSVELLLKAVAYGIGCAPGCFFVDPWAVFEGLIVIISWVPYVFPSDQHGLQTAVRAFRALRVVLALLIVPGMKSLINAVLHSIPALASVATLAGFLLLTMGITGVQFFKGVLHRRCATAGIELLQDPSGGGVLTSHDGRLHHSDQAEFDTGIFCANDPSVCPEGSTCFNFFENPGEDTISFDSVIGSFFPLVTTLVLDSWSQSMYAVMDAYSEYAWIYFCLMALLGGFLLLQLFLAVISETFGTLENTRKDQLREQENRRARRRSFRGQSPLSADAGSATIKVVDSAGRKPQVSRSERISREELESRGVLGNLVESKWFTNISLGAVIFNVFVMCLPYHGQPDEYSEFQERLAIALTWVFIIEMLLKLLGLGCINYWSDGWNVLDGSLVMLSVVEMLAEAFADGRAAGGLSLSSELRMLRMLRIVRALRVLRSWKAMYKVVVAFSKAIPQVANLILLMGVVMFIFAIVGMQLFGGTGISEESREHFDFFPVAMITVLNVFVGGYVEIYQLCQNATGAAVTAIYFVPAMLIGFLTLTNLFIGILLETFGSDEDDTTTTAAQKHPDGEAVASPDASSTPPAAAPETVDDKTQLTGVTCCCLSPEPRLRRMAFDFAYHDCFEYLILTLIFASSLCLAIDTPRLNPESTLKRALNIANIAFTFIFTLECVLKMFAQGFGQYISSAWNQLDLIIVCTSLLSLLAKIFPFLSALRSLRILRVLRPLRLLVRDPGMKVVVETLIGALPAVLNIALIIFALMVVFAILGMKLFMGSFGSCSDPSITVKALCVDDFPSRSLYHLSGRALKGGARESHRAEGAPIAWVNPAPGNFDNVFSAMLALFVAMTGDNMPDLMWHGMDAVGEDMAPQRTDFSPAAALFFIAWILVGTFVALNLFVGAIVENFYRIRAQNDGFYLLSASQKLWVNVMREARSASAQQIPRPPSREGCFAFLTPFRMPIFNIVRTQSFDLLMTLIIIANVLVLALDYHGIEDDALLFEMLHYLGGVFSCTYWVEFALKLIGYGPQGYVGNHWCRFEFSLLVCSSIEWGMTGGVIYAQASVARIFRVVRVLRMLRLFQSSKDLRELLKTLALSVPALMNVASVLGLVIFIFAVLGTQAFTYVKQGEAMNAHANFESFGNALLLLFVCMTGDSWSAMMDNAMVTRAEGCDPSMVPTNCGSWVAMPYFISFLVVANFIFLNLVVAIVLENFSSLRKQREERDRLQLVHSEHIDEFTETWSVHDPDADNMLPREKLPVLVSQLSKPLGVPDVRSLDQKQAAKKAVEFCLGLKGVREERGEVHFRSALEALLRRAFQSVPGIGSPEASLASGSSMRQQLVSERNAIFKGNLHTPRTQTFQRSMRQLLKRPGDVSMEPLLQGTTVTSERLQA